MTSQITTSLAVGGDSNNQHLPLPYQKTKHHICRLNNIHQTKTIYLTSYLHSSPLTHSLTSYNFIYQHSTNPLKALNRNSTKKQLLLFTVTVIMSNRMICGTMMLQATQDMIHPFAQCIHIVYPTHWLVTSSSLSEYLMECHLLYVQVILTSSNNASAVQTFIYLYLYIALHCHCYFLLVSNV